MPKLPLAFLEKMQDLLGNEFQAFLDCFKEPRIYGLRVNTNKISVAEFLLIAPWPLEPIPWIANGFYYDGETVTPSKHPYYYAGLYYLQEPSAMTPASRLPVTPGDRVLDLCAAPGGKATELGAKLANDGLLVANDISNSRAKALLKNIEVMGIGNVLITNEEPGKLEQYFPAFFDKILIDAPCSGEGMFRKDSKMVRAWLEHGPDFFAKIQKSIVVSAAKMLKPGGMLLYSTCTFDSREDEEMIAYLLAQDPTLSIVAMDDYEGFASGQLASKNTQDMPLADFTLTKRIYPHKMRGEGHYLALLKKEDTALPMPKSMKKEKASYHAISKPEKGKLPEELCTFLATLHLPIDLKRIEIRGERVFYLPQLAASDESELCETNLSGLRFLRTGLLLGEVKKKRFEPSQALAMHLRKEDYPYIIDLPISDQRITKYLKGETLEVDDVVADNAQGWYLVCVDGYPLGFGKLARQSLKNKYLPGWRMMS